MMFLADDLVWSGYGGFKWLCGTQVAMKGSLFSQSRASGVFPQAGESGLSTVGVQSTQSKGCSSVEQYLQSEQ